MLCVAIVILWCLQNSDCIPWPLQTATGCFGNTFDDFFVPSCNTSHVMAISGVFAMVKERTTKCPAEAESHNRDEEQCCSEGPEDCKMVYRATGMPYYSTCSGLETCTTNVARADTTCNITIFLDTSNYMLMEFYCIARSLILSGTSTEAGTARGTAVYVQNQGYPSSSEIGGSCSVASSCNITIVVTVIHLNLYIDNSNRCTQHLNITDGSGHYNIDCSHNSVGDYFHIRDVYISISNFLVFDFTTVVPGEKGQYWIEVTGSNPNSTKDLRCGSSAVSEPLPVDECHVNTITTSPSTTSHTLSTSERTFTTVPRITTQNWTNVLIITGILLAMMVVFPVILECISRRKQRANKVQSDNTQTNDCQGMPSYASGPEPEVIAQTPPTQELLSVKQATRQAVDVRTSYNDCVPPRRFGDTEIQITHSGCQLLPPVREPLQTHPPVGMPVTTSHPPVGMPTTTSQSPAVHTAQYSPPTGALNDHVGNDTIVEDTGKNQHMQSKRKKKKDKTNEDEGSETEGKTRKRKKKNKTKKTTDHGAEDEL